MNDRGEGICEMDSDVGGWRMEVFVHCKSESEPAFWIWLVHKREPILEILVTSLPFWLIFTQIGSSVLAREPKRNQIDSERANFFPKNSPPPKFWLNNMTFWLNFHFLALFWLNEPK